MWSKNKLELAFKEVCIKFILPFAFLINSIFLIVYISSIKIPLLSYSSKLLIFSILNSLIIMIYIRYFINQIVRKRLYNFILAFILTLISLKIFSSLIYSFSYTDFLSNTNLAIIIIFFAVVSLIVTWQVDSNDEKIKLHKKQNKYTLLLSFISRNFFLIFLTLFISTKFLIIIHANGSYIDEYLHVISGVDIAKYLKFSEFSEGINYNRGLIISVTSALYQKILGFNIFVVKLVPFTFAILNFILLYKISISFLKQNYVGLILFAYIINPFVIFNHYYIRFFVFYEFVFLLLTYLFLTRYSTYKNKTFFLITAGFIILISKLFSNDLGIYFCILPAIVSIIIVLLSKPSAFGINISRLKVLLITFIISIPIIFILNLPLKLWMLFFDSLATPVKSGFDYSFYFFNENLSLTILFIFGLFTFMYSNSFNAIQKTYSFGILVLFILHIVSSKDIQVMRVILYFIPIYIIFSVYGLTKIKNFWVKLFFGASILLSTIVSFPSYFLEHPYLPFEINIIDNSAFSDAKKICSDVDVVITSGRPEIVNYNSLKTDIFYFSRYQTQVQIEQVPEFEKMIYKSNDIPKYYYSDTEVINNLADLKGATNFKSFCFLEGFGLPNAWVDIETRSYLLQHATKISSDYSSSSQSFRSVIYLINP